MYYISLIIRIRIQISLPVVTLKRNFFVQLGLYQMVGQTTRGGIFRRYGSRTSDVVYLIKRVSMFLVRLKKL